MLNTKFNCLFIIKSNLINFFFSSETQCTMTFGIFLPPQAEDGKVPVIYWLSGKEPQFYFTSIQKSIIHVKMQFALRTLRKGFLRKIKLWFAHF